jgi:hypothetical protein
LVPRPWRVSANPICPATPAAKYQCSTVPEGSCPTLGLASAVMSFSALAAADHYQFHLIVDGRHIPHCA